MLNCVDNGKYLIIPVNKYKIELNAKNTYKI